MLVGLVYYCALDISDYIVLTCCKVCSIVMILGIHNFWQWYNLVGTATYNHRHALRSRYKIGSSCSQS